MQRHGGRRRRWSRFSVAVVTVVAMAAAACGTDDDPGTRPDGAASPTTSPTSPSAAPDTSVVLRVGVNMEQQQRTPLDPRISITAFDILYMSAMYAPLMKFDRENNAYVPHLAESVEEVDAQTFRVTLRSDAMFDNGNPVTSEDAKATIEAVAQNLRDGNCAGCNAASALIESVEVVDAQTFIIHTSAPALGVIFEVLSGRDTFIVPADAGAEQDTNPVGTGPFTFVSFTPGQSMTFTKSETYFDAENVNFAGIQFVQLLAGQPQANALLAGDVHVAHELGFDNFDAVDRAGLNALQFDDRNSAYDYVEFCTGHGSLIDDIRVRQALFIGTDRIALGEAVSQTPTWGLFGPTAPQYDPSLEETYAYDPDRAREMLEEAGVVGESFNLISNSNTLPQWPRIALVLEQQWERLGIEVNLAPSTDLAGDWHNFVRNNTLPPKGPMIVSGFSRPGLQKLTRMFHPNGAANPCEVSIPELTQITEDLASLSPTDPEAIASWKRAQEIIAEEVPVIPLLIAPVVSGTAANVAGFHQDIITIPLYADWEALSIVAD